jgi:hypothetical protein
MTATSFQGRRGGKDPIGHIPLRSTPHPPRRRSLEPVDRPISSEAGRPFRTPSGLNPTSYGLPSMSQITRASGSPIVGFEFRRPCLYAPLASLVLLGDWRLEMRLDAPWPLYNPDLPRPSGYE